MIGTDGSEIPGKNVVDAIAAKVLAVQTAQERLDRSNVYRMNQIRAELAERNDGQRILAEFAKLGPVPPEKYVTAAERSATA